MIFDDLREIQRQFGYLPAEQLRALAQKIDLPLYRLHGVASFYPHFRLTPPPRVDLRVCQDMSCHLRGACELRARLEAAFPASERDERNRDVAIRDVSCLGRCDEAPAVSINERIYAAVNADGVVEMVSGALGGHELPKSAHMRHGAECATDPYGGGQHYGAVQRLVETRDWDAAFAALKASGLRGLGGAGFPTESKWQLVRAAAETEKYIVCNADESEPGTFKDRFIMTNLPHLVIEGIIVAGLLTGARKGILYIRHEYEEQERILHEEIRHCRREGLLGHGILGSDLDFELEIFVSPGGYICGEESALLEAIEGKRAEPRNKPPFPVQQGLWNKPTAINNVETFANVPSILVRGADWHKAQGLAGTAGLKFIGVSGDVMKPGVYEVPMGTPVSDVIFRHGGGLPAGKKLKGFAPSGPSSGFLPASMADVRLDFKSLADAGSMLGSGALVVFAEGTCVLDFALSATRFFRNESCGKCVPCRVGSQKLVDLLTGWTQGHGTPADLALIEELSDALRLTSICGLGQVVPAPIASAIKHFRDEVDAHITRRECIARVCFGGSRPRPAAQAGAATARRT